MSSTYTSNLAIQLMGTGDQSGTWGATTNSNFQYLEEGISGYLSYAVDSTNAVTLVLSQGTDTSPSARNMIVNLTNGGATGAVTMTVPGTASKLYFIWNQTGQTVTVQGTTPAATVTIPNAAQTVVFCDGTNNVYLALGSLNNVSITGGTINNTTIGATTPSTGAFTTLSASTLTASGGTLTSVTLSGPTISAGTMDTTVIGGTTPAAGSFTTVAVTAASPAPAYGISKPGTTSLGLSAGSAVRLQLGGTNGDVTVVAPTTSGTTALTVRANGIHSTQIADSANALFNAGYLEVPQNSKTASYTAVLADSGKHIIYTAATASQTITIPQQAGGTSPVNYPIGTVITIVNFASAAVTLGIAVSGTGTTGDVLRWASTGATGARTLAQYGMATLIKITNASPVNWLISGTGLT